MSAHQASEQDINLLLDMLMSGMSGANSLAVDQQLKAYWNDPNFCSLLCAVAEAPAPCTAKAAAECAQQWMGLRALAGLLLKNNLKRLPGQAIDPNVLRLAGGAGVRLLTSECDQLLVRTAAQVVARVTARASVDWWQGLQVDLAGLLLDQLLGSQDVTRVRAGLFALQFLLEDAGQQIGQASELIIARVAGLTSRDLGAPTLVHAFRLVCQVYELGTDLDWNVDNYSPMQQGLCNSSHCVAGFATKMAAVAANDERLMRDVLTCFLTLLDYLEYFSQHVDLQVVAGEWIAIASRYVGQASSGGQEVSAAALDFLKGVVDVFERVSGEGPIAVFAELIEQRLQSLTPLLFPLMLMGADEERSALERDHFSIRDPHARGTTNRRRYTDDEQDDDAPEATLRRSASECLDCFCRLRSDIVFPFILDVITTKWADPDWHYREVALLALGAGCAGAYADLLHELEHIVPQLIASISAGSASNEHVCVTSMAAWTSARLVPWILNGGQRFLAPYLQALVANCVSESKRVQNACITALRMIITMAGQLGLTAIVAEHFQTLGAQIDTCLPHYHTTNLAGLCNLALVLMPLAANQSAKDALAAAFYADFPRRFERFSTTYQSFYSGAQQSVLVEKDVFDVGRVLYTYFGSSPGHEAAAMEHLNTWAAVLVAIADSQPTEACVDDVDLVENTLRLCSLLCACLSSNQFQQFQHAAALVRATLTLTSFPGKPVQGAACALLADMLRGMGAAAIGSASPDAVAGAVGELLRPETDLDVLVDAAAAVKALVHAGAVSNAMAQQLVQALGSVLRSDVFGCTLDGYVQLALQLCALWEQFPVADTAAFVAVADLLREAPNEVPKHSATIGLCRCLMHVSVPAEDRPRVCYEFLRCVFSWQKTSIGDCHAAVAEALQMLLATSADTLLPLLNAKVGYAYAADIFAHYGIALPQ